ncbi:receptor-like serine/threonine kinase [Corchorus olitorius]|uniref:Receptor-like serine/threonine kinase n=1 Tax=Corchorus olitorius TaxID=93759 RepID=A0A1R3FUD7_9ROSI|nr:receptor-like serine/threonine kinase [Corchorus olitorius]
MYSQQNNISRIYQLKKEITEIKQDDVMFLLASLKPEFEATRCQILRKKELPSYNTVCAILQQEETMKKAIQPEKIEIVEASAMMTVKSDEEEETKTQQHTYKGKAKNKPRCDHCQKMGHVKERTAVNEEKSSQESQGGETQISVRQLAQILNQLGQPSKSGM